MSDTYKLQYNGMTLAYPGWNGYVSYEAAPAYKTLTLCASNGGTLTADTITGMPGDTVTLSPIYDTYWRFSGYAKAGDGSISDNTYTFGNDNEQIVSAYFKKNTFTASGGFEKGSNVTAKAFGGSYEGDAVIPAKYAITSYHTDNVPADWYSTSNRWNVTTNIASGYQITLNPSFTCTTTTARTNGNRFYLTGTSLIGSTQSNTQTFSTIDVGATYSKSFTSDTTGVNYGLSGHMHVWANDNYYRGSITATYVATATTGTWVATGILP